MSDNVLSQSHSLPRGPVFPLIGLTGELTDKQLRLSSQLGLKVRLPPAVYNIDNWPKMFALGTQVILCANGYWTPRKRVYWRHLQTILEKIVKLIEFCGVIGCIIGMFANPAILILLPFFLGITWLAKKFFTGPIFSRFGLLMLGKRTVVEFHDSKIVIYPSGYGLSFPKTIQINPKYDLTVSIDDVKRYDHFEGHSDDSVRLTGYARRISIIQGTRRTPVAEVYEDPHAGLFKTGLDRALELQREFAQMKRDLEEDERRERVSSDLKQNEREEKTPSEPSEDHKTFSDDRWG